MSEPLTNGGQVRTLALRLPEELRTQLDVLAKINNRSTTAEITAVLEEYVANAKSDPKVLGKAKQVQEELLRKMAAEQATITSLFGASVAPEGDATGQSKGAAPQGEGSAPKDAGEASASPRPPGRRGKPTGD